MTWLDRPIAALDTETTGTDPEQARIVTACIGLSPQPGEWEPSEYRINPGAPIPAEARAIHGISDADVTEWGNPRDELSCIRDHLKRLAEDEIPVVGHNLAYDATLLDREFRRHLGAYLPEGLLFLDTLTLFRRFDFSIGGRRLEQLGKRFGITFPAHDATADALAALRLLHILAADNDLLPLVSVADLQHLQAKWHAAHQAAAQAKRLGNGQSGGDFDTHWPLIPSPERTAS